MSVRWTPQQRAAIATPGNLLVAAAAGAGKTAVLTERIVEKVCAGSDVRAILVVTFTNAAAGDMKKRIAARLRAAAQEREDERLRAAAEAVRDAGISTLHAFCAQILRRHFYEAGLDPAFRIADNAEAQILLEDALDALMEEKRGQDAAFDEACESLGGEERCGAALLSLHAFLNSQVDPAQFLSAAADRYDTDAETLSAAPLTLALLANAKERLHAAAAEYRAARDRVAADFPLVAAQADEELMLCAGTSLAADYASYAAALNAVTFARLSFPRGTAEGDKTPFQDARKAFKKAIEDLKASFAHPLEEEAARMRTLLPHVKTLCAAATALRAGYAAAKTARGVIDYADMEHMALALLRRAEIAAEYRAKYEWIFVDEYQDSSRMQEAILRAIKREDNLFLVGDVKQSIYRFRQAEPALFLEKYQDPAGFSGQVVDLNANFRSGAAILAFINRVFSRVMTRETGALDYDERAALFAGRETQGAVELHMIAADDEDARDAELEMRLAAERIRDIMQNERYTDPRSGETRPYRYGDFAVLHRAPRRLAARMCAELSRAGVPAYAELTGGYFDALEVQVFLNLLRLIDNRRQDVPMLSVLRSVIGGFSDAELAALRLGAPEGGWLDVLRRASREESALGQKAGAFLARLDGWYALSRMLGTAELCGALLDETGYGDYCAALPGGQMRRANLEALCTQAEAYERGENRSLSGFIAYMDRVRNTGQLGPAATQGADVVRLLSMHKSKGLEFPVVFLSGLSGRFNREDARQDLLLHAELGIGLRVREGNRRLDTLARRAVLCVNAKADVEEQMRILYVAMTRAQERLVLLLCAKDPAACIARHALPFSAARATQAASAADWILWSVLSDADGNALLAHADLPGHPGQANITAAVHTAPAGGEAGDIPALAALAAEDPARWRERFRWIYPYRADTEIPGKLSVSELAGNYRGLRPYPDFIAETRPLDAADKGTAAHLLMELIPLRPHTAQSVREFLASLVRSGRMTQAQADAVYIRAVTDFFASPLGARLCASPHAERERMFNFRVSARELIGADTDEPLLLQGVIDCCFLEDDQWVILDYKTDFVPAGEAYATARQHEKQLALYARALAALTGKPVKETYIHLLRTGESVRLG